MAGTIIPGEDDQLFAEPLLNGGPDFTDGTLDYMDGARGVMDDETFGALMDAAVTAAEHYVDTNLSPMRELAARYYHGEKFGNEVEGRSGVVATEVRDSILAMMPGLLRIFAGTKRPVVFDPQPGTPSEQADLQTEYVSHVIMRDNPGFEIIHDALKDALQRKTGIFEWGWEERELVTATRFSGLPEEAFALLVLEATDKSDRDQGLEYDVEVTEEEPDETQDSGTMVPDILSAKEPGDEELPGAQPAPMIRSGIVRRRVIRRRARVEAVPPEEFIVTPSATRDLDRFRLIGRRRELTIGEIVALGHDEDEVRELIGGSGESGPNSLSTNPEAIARNDMANLDKLFDPGFEKSDPASEYVKYCVLYVLVDYDGDGILERRKVVTVGKANRVIYNEIYDDDMVPYGTLCPDPEQHSPFGDSVADWTMDLQEIKSEILRGTLDSLSESITSSRAINKNNVNVDDALNPARGALIRINGAPSENIMDLSKPFVGANTLPVLQYLDEMRTRRTGTNPAAPSGIDADAIQSTAKEGVAAQIESAHERLEMIARIFAETGFSRLFRGVRNLVVRNQDYRRSLRLMGKPVIVDPRSWNADLDAVAAAGLGRGSGQKRVQGLTLIIGKQQEFIEKYGVDNPVCNLEHLSYAMGELVREMEFPDADRFFAPYTPAMAEEARKIQEQLRSQPSPQQLLLEAQKYKSDKEFEAKMAALMEKRESAIRADGTKKAQAEMTYAVNVAKLLGEYGKAVEASADARAGQENADLHRLADDANADSPALEPTPPAQPAASPQGEQA